MGLLSRLMRNKLLWSSIIIAAMIASLSLIRGDLEEILTVTPDPAVRHGLSPSTSLTKPSVGSIHVDLSYESAMQKYSGRRIQFDINCQAIPNNITVKNETEVMFDNRSGDSRWVSLNNVGYYIEGYDFTILRMASKKLPTNVVIDCGSAQNVGQIYIQR